MINSKVLLVEDDVWLSDLYADTLSEHSVIRAGTADEALELIDTNKIDLIVLDMFLPDHNGVEFLHEIASYEDSADIPVIILSAVAKHDFGMSDERMKHYGIVEYLYKPEIKPKIVAERVKLHLTEFVEA